MKVLKEGKWNEPWTIEIICSNQACEATLEVGEQDVNATNQQGSRYECHCCVCGRSIQIPAERIHLRVRGLADQRRQW